MICKNCGKEIDDNAKYCQECGSSTAKREEFFVDADHLVEEIKKLFDEGIATRIIIKDEKDRTLLDIPVVAGLVGAVIAPWLAAVGAIAAIAVKCKIVVEKREE
ncbi:MAG: Double zinc ribbon [Candidatus Methanofastidiosum methylothiophilum]|uniref:Double zinc ribbon n=1 Tax=Candidatus Methanofastidiosum methylothiophilum TaxID=1705564 RepID=A0A150IHD0_9EURY|nr:MAG: Double zinc ribbon [Candidatus Methanofastidiosum methylthiophilus]KYC46534.1 MAG: Double zinc ribbon [Candidatus Methanofastidiosum methylthiophilus]KYC51010.1 MAG: Double zinc ribbon [Candidatus Methanofastidiosum methylthiophilus]